MDLYLCHKITMTVFKLNLVNHYAFVCGKFNCYFKEFIFLSLSRNGSPKIFHKMHNILFVNLLTLVQLFDS